MPFETVGLSADIVDLFYNTYLTLRQKFTIEPTGYIDFQLDKFSAFGHCQNLDIKGSFVIKTETDNCYILFVENTTQVIGTKGAIQYHKDYQTWALTYLRHDLGRVLIRHETLRDKIVELLYPIELDFKEDKAFSDTFYVVADDLTKATAGITRNFRNAVMDIREDDFVIEVLNHALIIGNRKSISPQKSIHLAGFITRLTATH